MRNGVSCYSGLSPLCYRRSATSAIPQWLSSCSWKSWEDISVDLSQKDSQGQNRVSHVSFFLTLAPWVTLLRKPQSLFPLFFPADDLQSCDVSHRMLFLLPSPHDHTSHTLCPISWHNTLNERLCCMCKDSGQLGVKTALHTPQCKTDTEMMSVRVAWGPMAYFWSHHSNNFRKFILLLYSSYRGEMRLGEVKKLV